MDRPTTQPGKNMSPEPAEQLLDAFKAAALSVTRLYKTSTAANAKARSDGYQDCLDELLIFLDGERIGFGDGEGWRIRQWATERLDGDRGHVGSIGGGGGGGGGGPNHHAAAGESEDDAEKAEPASSPDMLRPTISIPNFPPAHGTSIPRTDSASSSTQVGPSGPEPMRHYSTTVPMQDSFTFQSTIPYPSEPNLNMESLDLSDGRSQENREGGGSQQSRLSRGRHGSGAAPRVAGKNRLGKGAGQKRRVGDDLDDIFGIGSLGYNGKDFFGGGKRNKHT